MDDSEGGENEAVVDEDFEEEAERSEQEQTNKEKRHDEDDVNTEA